MNINEATAYKCYSVMRTYTTVFCVMGLFVGLLCGIGSAPAFADELDEAWADLNAKTAEIEGLTTQLEEIRATLEANQAEMEEIAGRISVSQTELMNVQKRLAATSRLMYKSDDLSIWQIIVSSHSIDELISRIVSLNSVASQAAKLAEEEKRYQASLSEDYEAVSMRKDEALETSVTLTQTKEALEVSSAALKDRIEELEEEKALAQAAAEAAAALAAAEAAAKEAAAAEAAQVSNPQAPTEQVSAGLAPENPAAQTDSENEEIAEAPAGPEATPEPENESVQEEPTAEVRPSGDTSGWQSGPASAYGGSSDPSTPNPGTTATGAICDDYSTGVAVPLAWGPTEYYGRMVEISYNGMTVVATVNDCGGMGGGSRHLDLQPGVFKAFGFATCQEWGVREVQYRFL